jgi:quercetin dioxygenase-like cupin family protein
VPHRSPEDEPPLSEDIVQALAEAVAPIELSAQERDALRARVLEHALDLAAKPEPPDTETIRGDKIAWRQAWPGVWVKVLKRDPAADLQVTLMRFAPGGLIPGHPHRQNEECYVLEGEVEVGGHRVGAGDLHIARAGGQHPELVSRAGALVILRSELY